MQNDYDIMQFKSHYIIGSDRYTNVRFEIIVYHKALSNFGRAKKELAKRRILRLLKYLSPFSFDLKLKNVRRWY